MLDEPTNDLDIATLTVLEEYLDDFTGVRFLPRLARVHSSFAQPNHHNRRLQPALSPPTHMAPRLPQVLVVVSHDRWFCDRVLSPPACDEDDDNFDVRRSSLLVFEGDGAVSQFQGACSLPRF